MQECAPPFSFYFRLIAPYWRARPVEYGPLHRLTSLARKQGAQRVVIQDAAIIPSVAEELDDLDAACGGGGSAEAIAFSFFSEAFSEDDFGEIPDASLIGRCILINYRRPEDEDFSKTYIYEAIFTTPRISDGSQSLLNNFINTEATFKIEILGREFPVTGIYYTQQNGITSVCAHASIKMVVRTLHPDQPTPTNRTINKLILPDNVLEGVLPSKMAAVIEELAGVSVNVLSCEKVDPVSILAAATESGDLALLVFKTGVPSPVPTGHRDDAPTIGRRDLRQRTMNHVVVVFGHTRNSDEWHPQAIPVYAALPYAAYCPSSSWVDHFVIHDDNFGPYFTLSSRALENDLTVQAKTILVIRRQPCHISASSAESTASTVLAHMLPTIEAVQSDSWLHLTIGRPRTFVTRPVLVTKENYLAHVANMEAHDGSRATESDIAALQGIPDLFWMVEFTLADLFTGNRSKLGEVLIEALRTDEHLLDRRRRVIGIRLPNILLLRDADQISMPVRPFSIASHVGIYMHRPHDHQW